MPSIHVCSLARLQSTVARSGASHMVSLLNNGTPVPRPPTIPAERHLYLGFADITEPIDDLLPPGASHIERLIAFLGDWDREKPLVVHCFAGISRSSAGAFISLCTVAPERDEREIAMAMRRVSTTAFPNPLMVSLADDILGRRGRMNDAVRAMGRGAETYDANPFMLPIGA